MAVPICLNTDKRLRAFLLDHLIEKTVQFNAEIRTFNCPDFKMWTKQFLDAIYPHDKSVWKSLPENNWVGIRHTRLSLSLVYVVEL